MTKDGPAGGLGGAPRLPSRQAAAPAAALPLPTPPPPPPPPFHEDHRRELEALRAELEGERLRSQEARRRFGLEARELREAAERERQLLTDQLRSKWEQQRARELHQLREAGRREREAEIRQLLRWKEAELREAQELLQRERDAAMRQARDLQRQLAEELVSRGGRGGGGGGLNCEGRAKLQEVLGKLRWEVDGEQAARIRHLKAELELERSLFLKYILERFESEPAPAACLSRGRPSLASTCCCPKTAKARPRSLESLTCPLDGTASKTRSPDSGARPGKPPACPIQAALDARGSPQQDSRGPRQPPPAWPLMPLEKEAGPDSRAPEEPPARRTVLPEGEQEQPPEAGWLSRSSYHQLVKQNTELEKALLDLESRCTCLKDENSLLRRNSFPEMQEKVKTLKQKNSELTGIAKRLEERAKKLQESSLRVSDAAIPVALSGSDVDLCKMTFARQQAKELSEQASLLVAKDQQLQALQKECWELQTKLSTGRESSYLDRLLRESQKEVLRLQRQIMLKKLSESLQPSKGDADAASPALTTEETSPTPDPVPEKPPSSTEMPEAVNTPVKGVEPEAPTSGNEATETEKHTLESDIDSEPLLQEVKTQLVEKSNQCELLLCEVEEMKKKSDSLEQQLMEVLSEKVKTVQANAELREKSDGAEKIKNENAEIKEKLIQATKERNSAIQRSKTLEIKMESLEEGLKSMKAIGERQQQLESEHKETLLVLQKKEEEIRCLQHTQTGLKRDHEEAIQLLEAQVKELENQYQSQTEHFNLLTQELEQLQMKETGLVDSELSHTTSHSKGMVSPEKWEQNTHCCFHYDQNGSDENSASPNFANSQRKTDELDSLSTSSGPPPMLNSFMTCLCAENAEDELETGTVPLNFQPDSQGPSNLHVFLVRHSYNPFKGPNKDPEAELPLTAGEYVYIYGEMDADGFYEGELMDGRRGMIPSNLVEKVSANDLMSFVPSEASDLCCNSYHFRGISCHSISSEESPDEDTGLNPLSFRLKEGLCDNRKRVPYPKNLTLIKLFSSSVVIGWDSPQGHWGKIHSYNIYVNRDLFQNVKYADQMKAVIENLDFKLHSYRISVQSVTDSGLSDKRQCTFLVGNCATVAPTLLELQKVSATSAEITWLPSNSNCTHALYLNEKKHDITKPGIYWYTFQNLRPGNQYCITVETQVLNEALIFLQGNLEQKSISITFTTPSAGPPDAPLDVQIQSNSSEFFTVSWLPVTIDAVGSSNGVKVTGYAIYLNGHKVTEIMSPTAGNASLAASQLHRFRGSWTVSVRTMSPFGESEDSVPALIPPHWLKDPLWSKSTASNQVSDMSFQGLFDSEDVHPSTTTGPSPSITTHKSMVPADTNFTIHLTSNCRESSPTPLNIFQNCLPASMLTTSRNAKTEIGVDSTQHSSSPQFSHDYSGTSCLNPQSSVSPVELKQCSCRSVGTYNFCVHIEPCSYFEKNHTKEIKQLCKELSNLSVSQAEGEEGKISWTGRQQMNPGDHNGISDFSDLEEEEDLEHRMNFSGQENSKSHQRPISPVDLANDTVTPMTMGAEERKIPTVPHPSPQRQFGLGNQVSGCPARLFVTLFDYNPITIFPNYGVREQLPFKKGQILKVIGEKDRDGFYRVEYEGKERHIPSDVVSEMYIESEEVKEELLKKSYIKDENL